jgi:hypothetical protein
MTEPYQRARAIGLAGIVLQDLSEDLQQEMPEARRQEYLACIRHVLEHYPDYKTARREAGLPPLQAALAWQEPWAESASVWHPDTWWSEPGRSDVAPKGER